MNLKSIKQPLTLFMTLSLSLSGLTSCALQQAQDADKSEEYVLDALKPAPVTGGLRERKVTAQAPRVSNHSTRPDSNTDQRPVDHNTEDYNRIVDNPFKAVLKNPLSTFSIDVDTASYSNTRRFIEHMNQLPPADAVRIEEMVNYFQYRYPEPTGQHPFSITTDLAECPWNSQNQLLRIGLKGKSLPMKDAPPANLVFLLDVSGSMNSPNKLPLLKRSLKLVVDQMREQDHVSIVVYAGAAGTVLPPTSGAKKDTIIAALDKLQAGGSTAGAAGIELAYKTALQNFRPEGNNRVILATDGDFNVGPSSDGALERMIEAKRKHGVYLTVLGFGMGNYKDNKMETLADKGNGNYAYIDDLREARKVLVEEMGSTLLTIAKDVKLQLEFNPKKVKEYRLIGYENRLLAAEDFDNDKKDAGELGAGTTVTALYELVPADGSGAGHDLKYQNNRPSHAAHSNEVLTVKLRYKQPKSDSSILLSQVVNEGAQPWSKVNDDFRFAASVAGFGMQLRKSEYKGQWAFEDVLAQAQRSAGNDSYRRNFIQLAEKAQLIQKTD